jgi:HAD superfamily hydrolase (TIGR01509 family)
MSKRADDVRAPVDASAARPLEAVLLDVDGTLLDSNDAHAQAWSDTFKESGLEIGSETVRSLVGMGSDKLLPKLTGIDAESEEGKRLVERRTEIFLKEYLPTVRAFPNVHDLLDRMRSDGLKLVVASSAGEEELKALLGALGAEWLLPEATSSDDAERSKPDPDIVRAAVDQAGVGPERCVMVGDTPYDVEAATKASVRIVGVRCGGWGDEDLRGAAEIFDDPKGLLAHYDESLIGRGVRAALADRGGERQPGERGKKSKEERKHVDGA